MDPHSGGARYWQKLASAPIEVRQPLILQPLLSDFECCRVEGLSTAELAPLVYWEDGVSDEQRKTVLDTVRSRPVHLRAPPPCRGAESPVCVCVDVRMCGCAGTAQLTADSVPECAQAIDPAADAFMGTGLRSCAETLEVVAESLKKRDVSTKEQGDNCRWEKEKEGYFPVNTVLSAADLLYYTLVL